MSSFSLFVNQTFYFCWVLVLLTGLPGEVFGQTKWSLEDCLQHAEKHNLQLQKAHFEVQRSLVRLSQARSRRLPDLNIESTFGSALGRSIDPTLNTFVDQRVDAFDVEANSQLILFNGLKSYRLTEQRKLEIASSRMDLAQQTYDLKLEITLAYLDIIFQSELKKAAVLQQQNTQSQLQATSELVGSGVLARSDRIQLEAQIANENLQITTLENKLRLAYLRLIQLLQLDPNTPFEIVISPPNVPNPLTKELEPGVLFQGLSQTLPGLKSQQLQVESTAVGIKVAQADYYPSLLFGASVFSAWSGSREKLVGTEIINVEQDGKVNDQTVDFTFFQEQGVYDRYPFSEQVTDNISFSVGVGLSIPIFNRNQTRNQVELARLAHEDARVDYQLSQQNYRQILTQYYTDASTAYSAFQAAQQQQVAFEQAYFDAQKLFDAGKVNATEYVLAKNNLNRAHSDLIRTRYNYLFRYEVLRYFQASF